MKTLFTGLLVVFLGTFLGYLVHIDSGYIAIYYNNWTLETSVWVGIIMILLMYLVIHTLSRLFLHLFKINRYVSNWSSRHASKKYLHYSLRGIKEFAEQNWRQAEISMKKAAHFNKSSIPSYISAATSANRQSAYRRRDDFIQKALEQSTDFTPTIMLTQANLQMDANQVEQAIASLLHLLQLKPHFKPALSLLFNAYQKINDIDSLARLLPELRQHKVITHHEIQEIEIKLTLEKLSSSASLSSLQSFWQSLSKKQRSHPKILHDYIHLLIKNRDHSQAQSMIEKTLSKKWIPSLLSLYTLIQTDNHAQLLSTAEKWLKKHPADNMLFLALAKLALNASFYQKATDYSQQLLQSEASKKAWLLLAEINENQNKTRQALEYYKKATEH